MLGDEVALRIPKDLADRSAVVKELMHSIERENKLAHREARVLRAMEELCDLREQMEWIPGEYAFRIHGSYAKTIDGLLERFHVAA